MHPIPAVRRTPHARPTARDVSSLMARHGDIGGRLKLVSPVVLVARCRGEHDGDAGQRLLVRIAGLRSGVSRPERHRYPEEPVHEPANDGEQDDASGYGGELRGGF